MWDDYDIIIHDSLHLYGDIMLLQQSWITLFLLPFDTIVSFVIFTFVIALVALMMPLLLMMSSKLVRCKVLMSMKVADFWNVALYSLIDINQHFRGVNCLYH
jgi:hypothetical protein